MLIIIGYLMNFLNINTQFSESSINAKNADIPENNNLGPLALMDLIIKNHFVKFINMDEFSAMTNIDEGHFGTISKARWKKTNL